MAIIEVGDSMTDPDITSASLGANISGTKFSASMLISDANSATKGISGDAVSGAFDAEMTISSTADLKEKAPEVWEMMVKSISTSILRQTQRFQERMKAYREKSTV